MSGTQLDNPFPGPVALAPPYPVFGRDEELADLMGLIEAERVVVLYGLSGCGKSSLLRGERGVCHRFSNLPGHDALGPIEFRLPRDFAGGEGAYEAFLLEKLLHGEHTGIGQAGEHGGGDLDLSLFCIARANHSRCAEQLLVLDQFEDIFSRVPYDERGREQFFSALGELVESTPRLRILIALREEYLGQLARYRRYVPRRFAATFRLGLLNTGNATAAVLATARSATPQLRLRKDDVAKLIANLSAVPAPGATDDGANLTPGDFVEPLFLQLACREAWPQAVRSHERAQREAPCEKPEIPFGEDSDLHDLTAILHRFYEEGIAEIVDRTSACEARLRAFVQDALTTGSGHRPLVAAVSAAESWQIDPDILNALVDQHLVRHHQHARVLYLELAHDRLVDPVRAANEAWFARAPAWRQAARKWHQGSLRTNLSVWALLQARRVPETQRIPYEDRFIRHEWRGFLFTLGPILVVLAIIGLTIRVSIQATESVEVVQAEQAKLRRVLERQDKLERFLDDRNAEIARQSQDLEQGKRELERRKNEGVVNALLGRYVERKWLERNDQAAVLQVREAYVEALRRFEGAGVPERLHARFLSTFSTAMWILPDSPGFSRSMLKPAEGLDVVGLMIVDSPSVAYLADGCVHVRRMNRNEDGGPCIEGLPAEVRELVLSPDGRLLAARGKDRVTLLEMSAEPDHPSRGVGKALWSESAAGSAMAFASDGGVFAYSDDTGVHLVCLPQVGAPARCATLAALSTPDALAGAVAISGSSAMGRTIAVASDDGRVTVQQLAGIAADGGVEARTIAGGSFERPDRIHHLSSSAYARVVALGFIDSDRSDVEGPALIVAHRDTQVFEIARRTADGVFARRALLPDYGSSIRGAASEAGVERFTAATLAPGNRLFTVVDDDILVWHLSNLSEDEVGSDSIRVPVLVKETGARRLRRLVARGDFILGEGYFRIWSWEEAPHAASKLVSQIIPGSAGDALGSKIFHPYAAAFLADGSVLTGSSQHSLQRWSADSVRWQVEDLAACGRDFKSRSARSIDVFDASDDSAALIAVGMGSRQLMVLPAAPLARPLLCDDSAHADGLWAVAFSADGKLLASGDWAGRLVLWDVADGAVTRAHTLQLDGEHIWSLAFHPDRRRLAVGMEDGRVVLLHLDPDPASPRQTRLRFSSAEGIGPIWGLSFSSDGRYLAAAGRAGPIALWEFAPDTGAKEVPAAMLLEGHRGGTTTVAFRPNSTILASGGQDDLVRIWNAERPQDSPSRLSGVPSDILAVRWSADGSRLLSAHEQPMERRALNRSRRAGAQPARILHGTVLLWDWNLESATRLACKTVWANFERSEWERWIAPVSQREYAYTCPIE